MNFLYNADPLVAALTSGFLASPIPGFSNRILKPLEQKPPLELWFWGACLYFSIESEAGLQCFF